jgi:hypothetical protein
MYAKLIDGDLRIAPKMLTINGAHVWNASAEQYAAQGWLPVVFTDVSEPPSGYAYESGWAVVNNEIVQTWTLVELPAEEMSAEEALEILLGGEAE